MGYGLQPLGSPEPAGPVATLLLFLGCQSLAGFILRLLQWGRASRADGDRQGDYG